MAEIATHLPGSARRSTPPEGRVGWHAAAPRLQTVRAPVEAANLLLLCLSTVGFRICSTRHSSKWYILVHEDVPLRTTSNTHLAPPQVLVMVAPLPHLCSRSEDYACICLSPSGAAGPSHPLMLCRRHRSPTPASGFRWVGAALLSPESRRRDIPEALGEGKKSSWARIGLHPGFSGLRESQDQHQQAGGKLKHTLLGPTQSFWTRRCIVDLRACISNMLPGEAEAAGQGPHGEDRVPVTGGWGREMKLSRCS